MGDEYDNANAAFDAARFKYASDLSTSGTSQAVNLQNQAKILNDVLSQKQNAFEQVSTDMQRTLDMATNLKLYQTRTSDLNVLVSDILDKNKTIKSQLEDDKNVTKRQFEINEWYYYRKQEAAGTLMGVAIALGLILVAMALFKMGILSSSLFNFIAIVLGLFIGIWVYWRYDYNGYGRDPMLWHRRRFAPPKKDPPASLDCPPKMPTIDMDLGCVSELQSKFQNLLTATTNEIVQFQEGGAPPRGLCSAAESFVSTAV
jgi:hypothetical protein